MGKTSCKQSLCGPGKYGKSQSTGGDKPPVCTNCTGGRYSAAIGLQDVSGCNECPPGTGGSMTGATNANEDCGQCAAGKFSPGGAQCKTCKAGTWSGIKSNSCTDCPPGRYGSSPGLASARCTGPCPLGTSASKGLTKCTACNPGTFSSPARDFCAYCADAPNYGEGFTSDKGSDTCACKIGTFLNNGTCTKCPKGVLCNRVGSTLAALPVQNEFWRSSPESLVVLKCPHPRACLGIMRENNTSNNNNDSKIASSTTTSSKAIHNPSSSNFSSCLIGNGGVLCAVCEPDYARYGSREPCERCKSAGLAWFWAIFAAIAAISVLLIIMHINRTSPSGLLRPVIDLVHRLTVMLVFSAQWPSALVAMGNFMSGIFSGDIVDYVSPACIGLGNSYFSRFGMTVSILCGVLAIIWLKALWFLRRDKRSISTRRTEQQQEPEDGGSTTTPPLSEISFTGSFSKKMADRAAAALGVKGQGKNTHVLWAQKDSIIVLLLMYPGISGNAMQFFRCHKVGGETYLMSDYGQKCYDAAWWVYLVLIAAVLVFLSLGLPLAMAVALYRKRDKIFGAEARAKEAEQIVKEKESWHGALAWAGEMMDKAACGRIKFSRSAADQEEEQQHDQEEGKNRDDDLLAAAAGEGKATDSITDSNNENERSSAQAVVTIGSSRAREVINPLRRSTRNHLGQTASASRGSEGGYLAILHSPYKASVYWYEPLKMVFKLLLWCALVLFDEGSEMQLGSALIVNTVQLTIHTRLRPLCATKMTPAWLLNGLESGTLVLTCFINFSGFTMNYLELAKSASPKRAREIDSNINTLNVLMQIMAFTQVAALVATILRDKCSKEGRKNMKAAVKNAPQTLRAKGRGAAIVVRNAPSRLARHFTSGTSNIANSRAASNEIELSNTQVGVNNSQQANFNTLNPHHHSMRNVSSAGSTRSNGAAGAAATSAGAGVPKPSSKFDETDPFSEPPT